MIEQHAGYARVLDGRAPTPSPVVITWGGFLVCWPRGNQKQCAERRRFGTELSTSGIVVAHSILNITQLVVSI